MVAVTDGAGTRVFEYGSNLLLTAEEVSGDAGTNRLLRQYDAHGRPSAIALD